MPVHQPKVPSSSLRRLRAPFLWGVAGIALLGACSEGALVPGDGGPVGSGGAASGGATASGGAPASGGAGATGGAATGGTATGGGGPSGGAPATGGTASGGVGATSSGGAASGGAGTGGGAAEFALAVTGVDAVDNAECDDGAEAACPLYPEDTTSFGENVSPAMSWTAGPAVTLSYALTLIDLSNNDFTHWALWDIPPETLSLPAELPAGGTLTTPVALKQASGIGGTEVYFGSGACGNVYEFRLYALDTATLTVANASDPASVVTALGALTPLGETFVRMQSRDYCTP